MEFSGESLDDLLIDLYPALIQTGSANSSTEGDSLELLGVTLRLTHPRARLSRSATRSRPFASLGELLWYLSGSDSASFVSAYIPFYGRKGKPEVVNGAYGPRLLSRYGIDQIEAVMDMMRRKDGSRRAVIQLYEATDLLTDADVPCTTNLQFYRRGRVLHASAAMRSNDAYLGLPHDVFCFTMLQELIATELELEIGEYFHMVGSMHLYTRDVDKAERYVREGFQRVSEMPPVPPGHPFARVDELLGVEARIRSGETLDPDAVFEDAYWSDVARLIQIHFASRAGDREAVREAQAMLHDGYWHTFVEDVIERMPGAGGERTRGGSEDGM